MKACREQMSEWSCQENARVESARFISTSKKVSSVLCSSVLLMVMISSLAAIVFAAVMNLTRLSSSLYWPVCSKKSHLSRVQSRPPLRMA